MEPRVALIYICHNTSQYVREVADSWATLDYPKDRMAIIFIPNGATDDTVEIIEREVMPRAGNDLPSELILLNDGVNHGFAGGNNQGFRWAQERGYDYAYLNNGDLKLDPSAISRAVALAETDEQIGAVQSLMLFWNDPQKVNSTGGVMHVGGYAYARDNGKRLQDIAYKEGSEIMYPSRAATLYRVSALNKVGLLEEGFFMYHEDLELGLRLRIAGYRNVLSMNSRTFHDYHFGRNEKMFQWIETYRWVVLLAYLKSPTLFVLSPLLLCIELGSWISALAGGWFGAKTRAFVEGNRFETIRLTQKMRQRQRQLRVIRDRDWLDDVVGVIADQGQVSMITRMANALIDPIWRLIRKVIVW